MKKRQQVFETIHDGRAAKQPDDGAGGRRRQAGWLAGSLSCEWTGGEGVVG